MKRPGNFNENSEWIFKDRFVVYSNSSLYGLLLEILKDKFSK
tara:strand:+ start:365 stop:490 length:126 start_codon:yes stop_codon:yes gene_type:complete